MRDTWYVLEDGSIVDPAEVAPDASGRLVHKGGVAVAMKGDAPHSTGVDVTHVVAVQPDKPKRTYKNREIKAR
jgi:hypothetical protein